MRNILMTVMLLMVAAFLYTTIVSSNGGIRDQIRDHGEQAIEDLKDLTVGSSGSGS